MDWLANETHTGGVAPLRCVNVIAPPAHAAAIRLWRRQVVRLFVWRNSALLQLSAVGWAAGSTFVFYGRLVRPGAQIAGMPVHR